MALDFSALKTEVYARGLSYLNDGGSGATRVSRWINDSMHEINELADWPFLQTSTTGTAPLTVSDLRKVEAVTDSTNKVELEHRSRRDLIRDINDLTITGQPETYYVTGGTVVNVWPASTSVSLTVYYFKYATDLSANGDVPLIPDRFRQAIVDYAVARGLRDAGDLTGAAEARQAGDALVARMAESLGMLEPPSFAVPLVGDDC
jgi:hypothetical protein